jgi:hypothetical protein
MGTDTITARPAVGSIIVRDGVEYVVTAYPTANLDVLSDVVFIRKVGGKRSVRANLSKLLGGAR